MLNPVEPASVDNLPAAKASGYDSCQRRCEPCGLGLSNAFSDDLAKLTLISRDPLDGLEGFLDDQCRSTLDLALNQGREPGGKWREFQSANSEDRVTWVVIKYLQRDRLLADAFDRHGRDPALLLWGAPVPNERVRAGRLRDRLLGACDSIGEHPDWRSEPDVTLDFDGEGVVLAEIKLKSVNPITSAESRGWDKYLRRTDAFADPDAIRESGLYQLARNWRLGWELAGGRQLTLLNIGPTSLRAGKGDVLLKRFAGALNCPPGREFHVLSWQQFLSRVPLIQGLDSFVRQAGLLASGAEDAAPQ